jgi:hypothetical protein
MRETWLKLVAGVLRPARSRLDACREGHARHLEARRPIDDARAEALASCVSRIEALRAEAFAANDGVVTWRMTELEREWRRLSRVDRDGEAMDLWARIAPPAWIDRKRFRDCEGLTPIEAAMALASDVEGVEAAEAAALALRHRLAPWGTSIGARVRWRASADDFGGTAALLAAPLEAALSALSARDGGAFALAHARAIERDVLEAAAARFPDRPVLARALADAAFVDAAWRASSLPVDASPVRPLFDLWSTGYVLASVDARGTTILLPVQREHRAVPAERAISARAAEAAPPRT